MPGSMKETFLMYALKAGFLYTATPAMPTLLTSASSCGGELILSRFPIVRKAERQFSYGLFGDAEATVGIIYSEIAILAPSCGQHSLSRESTFYSS
jgi:hypothetical protein